MSERFQKYYISVREFVDSWDKELYELNNLDFFIYLMINQVGNQLEKRYFIRDKKESGLFIDFDQIGTLCFNIGDGFEFFLEENCLGSCSLNCPRDLDGEVDPKNSKPDDNIKRKIQLLNTLMSGDLDKEQCLRVDLMNHVILDTLLHFYSEEFEMELNEENRDLLELAEFIEDVIIDFIRIEGQSFLNKPFDTALEYFEELLQSEADETDKSDWFEDASEGEYQEYHEEWQKHHESISDVFLKFSTDEHYNPPHASAALIHDLNYFNRYLQNDAKIENIYELSRFHLAEFFSVWLIKELVMTDDKQIQFIFRATARFITFLFHQYNINLKQDFLRYYELLKTDLPRILQATNQYISEYNLLEVILSSESNETEKVSGYFEITKTYEKVSRLCDVVDLQYSRKIRHIKLDSSAYNKLRKGDILHASVIHKNSSWEIFDIEFIFPNSAKEFVQHNY